jgi:small GTP-binding protein
VNSAITDPELNYGLQSSEPKGGRKRSKNTIHDREDAYYGVEEVASDGYRGLTHSDSEDKELDESLRESSSDAEISGTYGLEEDNTDVNYSTKEIDYIVEDLDDIEGLKGAVEDGDKEDKVKTRIERRLKRLHRAHLDAGVDVVEDAVPPSKLPIIAVIGRPNTGKSTIVNRICDTYNEGSIVDDAPGVTRDRSYRPAVWNGYNFQVVDTGGILFDDKAGDVFTSRITEQAMIAIDEAVACVFVCDGIAGVTDQDRDVAEWLRRHKSHIPIYLAVNKCESEITGIAQALDFNELGLGEAIPVSGIHGIGIGDVLDKITENHMKKVVGVLEENVTNVAFIGRPNVGKSSLFNKIYGKNRTIVSDVAGTTRDPIDEIVTRGSDKYRIIDTAGIRKKSKVDFGTEFFMINRSAMLGAPRCFLILRCMIQ